MPKAARLYRCVPLKSGLENRIDVGWRFASVAAFVVDPGHTVWYGTPSKSASDPKQPATLIWVDCTGGWNGGAKQ